MNNNKKTRLYREENGDIRKFNTEKFRTSIDTNRRPKKMTVEEYVKEIAKKMSSSYDTIEGWRKGKNAPQDIKMVFELEEKMNLPKYSLLYSEIEHLKNEILLYKNKLELAERKLKNKESQLENKQNNFVFAERLSPFCLRYDGFSNLIDILIGYYWGEEDSASTYAEELSYIISDYLNTIDFAELLGFKGQRSREEVREYLDNTKERNDETFLRWLNEVVVDSKGNQLYDDNNKINIHGIQLWQRLKDSPILMPSDKERVTALVEELINNWNELQEPYATCSITIQYEDIVLQEFRLGMGYSKPTHNDRMDAIVELLFLTDGRIEPYTLENAIVFRTDQFEMEMEIVFDLSRL
jgi:hypothetical protein